MSYDLPPEWEGNHANVSKLTLKRSGMKRSRAAEWW